MKNYLLTHFDTNEEEVKEFEFCLAMLAVAILLVLDTIFKFIHL